jgi:hypothetical protein
MLYDSNGFKPYIYFFVFQNLSMCHTYIYSIGPTAKSVEYHLFRQFLKFLGHVWPMAQTYLASRTCLAPGLDMFRSQASSLYKAAERRP